MVAYSVSQPLVTFLVVVSLTTAPSSTAFSSLSSTTNSQGFSTSLRAAPWFQDKLSNEYSSRTTAVLERPVAVVENEVAKPTEISDQDVSATAPAVVLDEAMMATSQNQKTRVPLLLARKLWTKVSEKVKSFTQQTPQQKSKVEPVEHQQGALATVTLQSSQGVVESPAEAHDNVEAAGKGDDEEEEEEKATVKTLGGKGKLLVELGKSALKSLESSEPRSSSEQGSGRMIPRPSPEQEKIMAAKYASIDSLEERAFTILADLGMVVPTLDFNI